MFRLKLSKFKQAFAVAILPRILVREFRPVKKKINNYTFDVFNKFGKSTDSGSKDEVTDKQRQIIDKCFGEHEPEGKYQGEEKEISRSPEAEYVRCSECRQNEEKASYDAYNAEVQTNEEAASVKATTARIIDEALAQKVEKIDETPHVEASPKDIEGFNSTPKVMGHDIEFFANEKIQQIDLDDLAKRCVGAPIGNIDELLLKEMKNMSLKNCQSDLDMNLVRGHCVEKYYSGIFEHLTQQSKTLDKTEKKDGNEVTNPLDLFYDNSISPEKELKSERITPLHTDSLHLFTIDEGYKDFKETGLIRDSCMDFTTDVKDTYYNQPEVLTPYGGPVFPFYEYGTKEPIILEQFKETTTATVAETGLASNIPEAQDIHVGKEDSIVRDIDPLHRDLSRVVEPSKAERHAKEEEFSYITDKIGKMTRKEKTRPKVSSIDECSGESPFTTRNQSYLKLNDIYLNPNQIGTLAKVEMLKLLYLNASKARNYQSRLYSTPSEFSTGDEMNQEQNSAISGRLDQEFSSREGNSGVDLPTNSAISANQNPGEYYTLSDLHESLNFLHEPWPTLTADCHNIHSALWTPLHKNDECYTHDSDDTIHELGYPIVLRDPFSYVCSEQVTPQKTVLDTLNEQISSATADKITFSADADVTTKTDDGRPLSEVLKQIRNKNRLEFCRNLLLQCAKPNAKKLTCFPPLDRSKPRTNLYPRPCQPKPKEKPDNKPEPCRPKKDPCAKFLPFLFSTLVRSEIAINIQAMKPLYHVCAYKTMVADEIVERLRNLYKRLQFVKFNRDINFAKDANCARDFEPWIPIPSWPVPKVEKKRPFVCPKEGCKQFPVPQTNPPKQKPCPGMPRKRFSFAAINTPEILIN
ncbi:unnamed protein product [Danaus chrysippus]|uniref:(African queen) hypothetical protein n=1 Tax=Danaus chrysippus TaxID=151541 RepID=A0A8J2R050_9NEOP|nr:unnamed protein product [Danaus chrysippus]